MDILQVTAKEHSDETTTGDYSTHNDACYLQYMYARLYRKMMSVAAVERKMLLIPLSNKIPSILLEMKKPLKLQKKQATNRLRYKLHAWT